MLAVFCLRLGTGMLACLLLLPPALIHQRFYRTHFLTTLALSGLAFWFVWGIGSSLLLAAVGVAAGLSFVSTLVWSVEGAPGGRTCILLTCAAMAASIVILEETPLHADNDEVVRRELGARLLGDATSAALLGAAMTAMLIGHSYLISPGLSMTPLLRLLGALALSMLARGVVDWFGHYRLFPAQLWYNLGNDVVLWVLVRWVVGFVLPLVLTAMAWRTARIRSTQSATGILYVVVIFCFLGELTGLLLRERGIAW